MPTRHFFVDGKDLGQIEICKRFDLSEAESDWLMEGIVYVSPLSGRVWATLPVMNKEAVGRFFCLTLPAPGEAAFYGHPAGSLLNGCLNLIDQLNSKALLRELHLHMSHYEKEAE